MGITEKLGNMGIPGFRSGKKWKMAVATFGYFWIFMIVLATIFGGSSDIDKTGSKPIIQPTIAVTTYRPTVIATTQIPEQTPVQVDKPEILSYSTYTDNIGYYKVVGEVDNSLQYNINYVKITATFYDSQDKVIGTDFTYTELEIMKPGQKSPFEISSYPDKISPARTKLSVSYRKTGDEPYDGLKILSKSSKTDDLGYYKTVGEVENSGKRKSTYVKVIATYYDSSGKVIGKSFTYTDPQEIGSGDTAPFELSSYPQELSPDTYELVVQGK